MANFRFQQQLCQIDIDSIATLLPIALMDETSENPCNASATSAVADSTDRVLSSFLESVGAGPALPLFRASGFSDESMIKISEMNPETIHQTFGLSHQQSDEFLACVGQHLTNQFLQDESIKIRSLVENAGFDYGVFASVDFESQQEILSSLKRRRTSPQAVNSLPTFQSHQPSFARHLHQSSDHDARVHIADMSAQGHVASAAAHSQLDLAVSILAEFFPSMQAEAIADMLHSMGLRLDEAVDTILEDMPSSNSKRKSSSHSSLSRLDAVQRIGATRSGVEGADWKSVYSWISASTGQASCGSVGSASADASLDSLVAFMKVAMNVDDPAACAEQSLLESYKHMLATRGSEHQLTIVAACHLAACYVDQMKHSSAFPILQCAMQWFQLQRSRGLEQLSFTGLSDETAKQFAHVQILYADCLIADARANGDNPSLFSSSVEVANKSQSQILPKSDCAAAAVHHNTSRMTIDSAAPNDSGHGSGPLSSGGRAQNNICDACEIVLPSSALCYECTVCADFHLCVPCHEKYEHCNDCHEFEVVNTRAPVSTRPLCIADAYLRNALSLPSLSSLLNDATLMKARLCVAECYFLQRRYSECETICREIILNNSSRRAHPVMFKTLMCLGTCLAAQFKWDESQTIFEQVLSHYDSQKGRNSADSLAVLMQISLQFYRRGCPLLALPVLEDCHARHVSVRGNSDLSSIRCASMLGHFYAVISDDSRALAILNDAVLKARTSFGDNSRIAMDCKYNLGIAFFIQKNFSSAMDCFLPLTDTAMIHTDNLVDRARLSTITHKAKIASFQCLANVNRLSEAITSLQELQSVHDNIFGRQHKYYGRTLIALARAQHLSGNARAARCLYDKAVPLLSRLLGPQHHEVISANVAYASALMELQQFRVALPLLESTYTHHAQCMGESHPSSLHTHSLVSLCQSLHSDSGGLQLQRPPHSESSSIESSPLPSPPDSSPAIAATWQLSDSEVSYWMLQHQSRDDLSSADPLRAPAPPPDVFCAAEGFSILQPIENSEASDANEGPAGDIGDDERS